MWNSYDNDDFPETSENTWYHECWFNWNDMDNIITKNGNT